MTRPQARVGDLADEYLALPNLAAYSKVSVRQLRKWIALPPGQALPCYRYGRNHLVVRRSEFDIWFMQYRQRGKAVLTRVLRDLGLDPAHLADTRTPPTVGRGAPVQGAEEM